MKNLTLIELMLIVAVVGIALSIIDGGIQTYKDNHANDSKPVIEFRDISKNKIVPQ